LIVATFLLARHFVSPGAALAGALLMALHPLLLYHATVLLSHVTDACFVTWGMWFLCRWQRRGGSILAFVAGLLLGFAVTIRYTEALLFLPAALAVLWRWRSPAPNSRSCFIWRELPALAVGAIVGVLPLLVWDQLVFGRPWATGYAYQARQLRLAGRN
jgi:4-amino-4-deoxy-L-arabinose transferase-like glycosyltransferase